MKHYIITIIALLFFSISLSGNSNNEYIQKQLTQLFEELEYGFEKHMVGEPQQGEYQVYFSTKQHVEVTGYGYITKGNAGVLYFRAEVIKNDEGGDKWKHKDELIYNINNYSGLGGYKIEGLLTSDKRIDYVVRKSGRTIGFISLLHEEEGWGFSLFESLDRNQLNQTIQEGCILALDKFNAIQGGIVKDDGDYKVYGSNKNVYGSAFSNVTRGMSARWVNAYFGYPISAMWYQLIELDINLTGGTRTIGDEKKFLHYKFMESGEQITILLEPIDANGFLLTMAGHKIVKLETKKAIPAIQDDNVTKFVNELSIIAKIIGKSKGIIDGATANPESVTLKKLKSALTPIVNELKTAAEHVINARSYLNVAIQNAENANCAERVSSYRKMITLLDAIEYKLNHAEDKMYVAVNTVSVNMAFDQFEKSTNSFFDAYRPIIDLAKEYEIQIKIDCDYKGALNNSTSDPKTKISTTSTSSVPRNKVSKPAAPYVAPPKTYDANSSYPAFNGAYEGDDLFLLMGRHWDDPAIKTWLANPSNPFVKSSVCSSEFCSYRAKGITLTFAQSHLRQMDLFQSTNPSNGTFYGRLPKGIQLGAAANSINSIPVNWRSESQHYKDFFEDKIRVQVNFDHINQSKIVGIKLQKEIVADAKEDLEQGKVDVGMRISAYGKIAVTNTLTGYAAKKAGIREGMQILEVDGTSVSDKSKYAVIGMLEGKKGSTVKVKFCPRGQPEKAKEYLLYRGAGGKAELISPAKVPAKTPIATAPPQQSNPQPSKGIAKEVEELVGLGFTYDTGKDSDVYEIFYLSATSAAYKAGVRSSDDLLKVNGTTITGKSMAEVKQLIEGKKGSSVVVTVQRDGKQMDYTIIR